MKKISNILMTFFIFFIYSSTAFADPVTYTIGADSIWANDGDQTQASVTHAKAGDNVNVNGHELIVSGNATANDGGGLYNFTLGDITGSNSTSVLDIGAGGDSHDFSVTINSVNITAPISRMQVDNGWDDTDAITATVTNDVTVNELDIRHYSTTAAANVALTVNGSLSATTTVISALGRGAGSGNATLTVNGSSIDLGTCTFNNGTSDLGTTTLTLSGSGDQAVTGTINGASAGDGILNVNGTGNTTISNAVGTTSLKEINIAAATGKTAEFDSTAGATTITMSGAGKAQFDGAVTATNFNITGNGTVDIRANSTLTRLSGSGGTIKNDGLSNVTITTGDATDSSFSGVIIDGATNSLAITKTGSGVLTLSGTNTYTGTTTVSGGTLIAAGNAAALGAGSLTMSGGKLQLADNTGLNFGRNTTVSSSSEIDSGRLTGAGAGTTNTLGTLSINGSTLTVGLGDALTTSGTQGLTFGDVTLTGNATITTASTAGGTATGLLTLGAVTGGGRNFTVTGTEATTITGTINTNSGGDNGGAVSVTQDGAININSAITTRGGNRLANWDPATGGTGGAITINSTAATVAVVGDINTNGGNGQSTSETGAGGTGGAVTINAGTTAVVGNITTQGGTGQSTTGAGIGGTGGAVDITAGTSITLNGYIYALTGPGYSTGGPTGQGNGGNVHLHGATILGSDITINTTGATAGEILFANTLNGTTDFTDDLNLTAGNGNVTFTGIVGGTKKLGAVTISSANVLETSAALTAKSLTQSSGSGSSHFDGAVTTTGATATAGGAVSINTSGEVHFASTITSTGGSQNTLADPAVGGAGGAVTINSTTDAVTVAGDITTRGGNGSAGSNNATGGAGGDVTINAATTAVVGNITTKGGDASTATATAFAGAGGDVDITAGTSITLNGNIDASTGSATSASGSAYWGNGGNVHLHGATILGSDISINTIGATDGNILFANTLNGTADFTEDLTLTADTGTITFTGIVGGAKKLGAILINSVGTLETSAALTAKSFTQSWGGGSSHFDGAVTTTGDADTAGGVVSIDTAGEIHFGSTITSDAGTSGAGAGKDAGAVHLHSTTGNVEVDGAISAVGSAAGAGAGGAGGAVTISSSTATAVGAITTNGGAAAGADNNGGAAGTVDITTGTSITLNGDISAVGGASGGGAGVQGSGGNVHLHGATILGSDITINTSGATAGEILFANTLNGTTDFADDLNLTAGNANVTFTGVVGGTKKLGAITINSVNILETSAALTAKSLTQSAGTGSSHFDGAVTTTGAADTAGGAVSIDTAGEIHFGSTITSNAGTSGAGAGNAAGAITLDSSAGNVEVDGAISAVGSTAGAGVGGAGGAVTISSNTTAVVGAINTSGGDGTLANAGGAAGAISITGAGTTLNGNITARGGSTATGTGGAGGDVTLASPVTLGVNLTIDTRGGIPTGAGIVGAGGDIDFKDTVDGAQTLNLNAAGDAATDGSISFDGAVGGTAALGAVTITDAKDVTVSDIFSADSLTQTTGSGTTTLMGNVTTTTATGVDITTGAITLDGLTIDTSAGDGVVRLNAPVTLSSGAVGITGGTGAIDFTGTVDTGGQILTITNAATGSATISGAVSGTGGLAKSGAGALHLDGDNTFTTGGITLNDGTLNLGSTTALGGAGSTFTINGGTIDADSGSLVMANANPIDINSSFTFTGTNDLDLGTGAVDVGNALRVISISNAKTLTLGGAISGTGGVHRSGGDVNGELVLSGNNVHTGKTMVTSGILTLSGDNSGASGGVTTNGGILNINSATALGTGEFIVNGGTIDNTSGGDITISTANSQTWAGSFTYTGSANNLNLGTGGVLLVTGSPTITVGGNTLTVGGAINSGAWGITKDGAGTLELSGANTYVGPTTVNAGTLKAGVASVANVSGAFGNNSAVTMADVASAILDITGFNTQIGSLTGGGTTGGNVTLGAATLTIGGDGTSPAAYAGVISGTGGITKIGAGTLTLNGVNTYTGTTTVNAGTLALNEGLTSSAIDYTGNGIVNVAAGKNIAGVTNSSGAATGTLNFLGGTATGGDIGGAGALALTAVNFNGATTLGHNIGATNTNINAGSTVTCNGNRTIDGALTLANSATAGLDLGANTLTVNGVYTQNANSTLSLTANSVASSGNIVTNAASVIDAGSAINVNVNGYLPNKATITVVNTGGLGIGAAPATVNSNNSFVSFTAAQSGGNLILTVNRGGAGGGFAGDATTPGSKAVGWVLDNVNNPSGDMLTVLNTLETGTSSQIANSLNSFQPDLNYSVQNTSNFTQQQFTQTLISHLNSAPTSGTGVSTGSDVLKGVDVWAQGFGSYLHQAPQGFSNGYNATLWGTILGFEVPLINYIRTGIAGGFSQNFIRGKDFCNRTDANSYQGTVYGKFERENFYIDTSVTFAYNTYDASRLLYVITQERQATAKYNGQQYDGYIESGYTFHAKKLQVTPYTSFEYMNLHIADYAESGAGAMNLTVGEQNNNLAQSGFGIKLAAPFATKYADLIPEFRVKWLYDWVGQNQQATSSFTGGGAAFLTSSFKPDRSSWDFGTKLTICTKNNVTLAVNYDFETKEDFYAHYGYVNVKYSF